MATGRPVRRVVSEHVGPAWYSEIADDLLGRIDVGEWRSVEALPQTEELAKHHSASRNAVARAVGKPAREGRLRRDESA